MNVWAYNVRGSLEWKATTDKEQAKKMAESPRFEVRPTPAAAPVDARDADVTALQECIAYAETGSMRGKPVGWHRDMIRAATKALAALASQAAAPAEGDPK